MNDTKQCEFIKEEVKVVEVVSCTCDLFGWKLSASKPLHPPAKPAVLSSTVPK